MKSHKELRVARRARLAVTKRLAVEDEVSGVRPMPGADINKAQKHYEDIVKHYLAKYVRPEFTKWMSHIISKISDQVASKLGDRRIITQGIMESLSQHGLDAIYDGKMAPFDSWKTPRAKAAAVRVLLTAAKKLLAQD